MASIESMTVAEIRSLLVDKYGYSQEEVDSIKGKRNLGLELARTKYNVVPQKSEETLLSGDGREFFDSLEIDKPPINSVGDDSVSNENSDIYVPTIGSAEWEDYVVAHLLPTEFFEKNGKLYPKAAGLRRITQLLIGDIIESGPIREYAPLEPTIMGRATIVYEIKVSWLGNLNDIRTFREAADAWIGNTPDVFAIHPVATASSRAEGRCLKKILQINLHTAEEMISNDDKPEDVEKFSDGEFKDDAPITGAQISNITRLCERYNINIPKFIEYVYSGHTSSLVGLTSSQGSNLCATLNKYQSKGKDRLEIPEEIKMEQSNE